MNSAVQHTNDRDENPTLSSIDSFVVGIAPIFWSHIPLLIGHIKNHLHVVDGKQCFVINFAQTDDQYQECDASEIFASLLFLSPSTLDTLKIVPISKCHLVGTIVNCERKSNGSNMYILDDGTGLIDVLHYSDGDLYTLPSLTTGYPMDNVGSNTFEPGDMVRVFGRIQCRVVSLQSDSNYVGSTLDGKQIQQLIPACNVVREIVVSLILPLTMAATNRSRARPNSIDLEWEHWKDCANFFRQKGLTNTNKNHCNNNAELPSLNNAEDVLPLLGSDLVDQMMQRNSVLSSRALDDTNDDDMNQAWRIFGTYCPCTNMVIKRNLLYCHCIATRLDHADPNLVYRDALLTKLLASESQLASSLPPPKSVNDIWNDIISEKEDGANSYHYEFQYSSIVADDKLNQIAIEEISKSSLTISNDTTLQLNQRNMKSIQELIRGTVRALRKDGILYLIDANTDTYLLLSRAGVLEPFVRTKLALLKLSVERRTRYEEESSLRRFQYMKSVPRSRLDFVRRRVMASMKM